MVKERYLWVAFIVIIAAAALYYREFNQAQIAINVSVLNFQSHIYPYQEFSVPMAVENTGSAPISNLSFGLYINGNVTRTYRVSLPTGSKAVIYYNYTPTSSGVFNVSLVADPAKLYDITNRQNAQASTTVYVLSAEKAEPYIYFPSNGLIGKDFFGMSSLGYISSVYFYSNFSGTILGITSSPNINNFVYPAIDVYLGYINRIYVAHAYYANYTLVSLWIKGYLGGKALYEAAIGKSLNVTYKNNMTFINFGNSSTMCSWYSNGWTKSLISQGGKSCSAFVNNTGGTLNANKDYLMLKNRNVSMLNYTGTYGNLSYGGDMSTYNGVLVYENIMQGGNFSNLCYGGITSVGNVSYCSVFSIGSGNYILSKVSKIVGGYNVSAAALSNLNNSQTADNYAGSLVQSYNISGKSVVYISAFTDRCFLLGSLECYNTTFNSTQLGFRIKNLYNNTVTLTSVQCFAGTNSTKKPLSITIAPNANAVVTTPCYANGQQVTGLPVGFQPNLVVGYRTNSSASTAFGYAYIYG